MNIGDIIEKITVLRPKMVTGGLEISDFAARFARLERGEWKFFSERFAPGVVQNGEVKDEGAFVESLGRLHAEILGQVSKKRVTAVVSLNSGNIYSQVFTLPIMGGEDLKKAIDLNIQMVSPEDLAKEYAAWEILDREPTTQNLEVFAAFIARGFADQIRQLLATAGFSTFVFEFRALALARFIREAARGFDPLGSYLVLALDNDGLDSLVVRRGKLCFEYFNFWRDIFQKEDRAIPLSVFESAVLRNIHQVLNFYNQHWPNDSLAGVFVSAGDLTAEAGKIIKDNFSLLPIALETKSGGAVPSERFVSWGSAFRALLPRRKDKEINFLEEEAQEELYRERVANFFEFWRVAIPISLAVFLALFIAGDFFLTRMQRGIEENMPPSSVDIAALEALQAKAKRFNDAVAFVRAVRKEAPAKSPLFEKVNEMARTNGVRIDSFVFPGTNEAIKISGEAQTTEKILLFKTRLESDAGFGQVNLPITEIRPTLGGQSFAITFFVNSPIAQ